MWILTSKLVRLLGRVERKEKIVLVTRQPLLPTDLPHSLQKDRAVLFLMGRSVVDGKITFASIKLLQGPHA